MDSSNDGGGGRSTDSGSTSDANVENRSRNANAENESRSVNDSNNTGEDQEIENSLNRLQIAREGQNLDFIRAHQHFLAQRQELEAQQVNINRDNDAISPNNVNEQQFPAARRPAPRSLEEVMAARQRSGVRWSLTPRVQPRPENDD